MKILLAPDSLKESLSAERACKAMERGIRKIIPQAEVVSMPMADGGEGTVNTLVDATQGEIITIRVHDPLMRIIDSFYGILGDGDTAIIEVASASGLALLKKEERNPLKTSTYGTGELIRNALDRGCTKILIGLGGSATNDGGVGMAMALGVKFLDDNGLEVPPGGGSLNKISTIDISSMDPRIRQTTFIVACDVTNPLYGEKGASFVFGPQKGADPAMVKILDGNLCHYSEVLEKSLHVSVAAVPGAGAAGGLGAGLLAFCKADLKPGFSLVSEITKLEDLVKKADLILTTEGKTDLQTLSGKVPYGVALLGKKYKVPVILFTGSIEPGSELLYEHGISSIVSICQGPVSLEDAIANGELLLESAVERIFRILSLQK